MKIRNLLPLLLLAVVAIPARAQTTILGGKTFVRSEVCNNGGVVIGINPDGTLICGAAGSGTGTVTHTTGVLVLGQPLVGNGTGDTRSTQSKIDASVQGQSDACADISTDWTNLSTITGLGGVNDAGGLSATQTCAATPFTGYPANFSGALEFAPNIQLQTSVGWVAPMGLTVEGKSGHPVANPPGPAMGSVLQASNSFPTSTPLFSLATGPIYGIRVKNIRLTCVPPSGTPPAGCIAYQNTQGQEQNYLENVALDGATDTDLDIEGGTAQNNYGANGIVASLNNVNTAAATCGRFGKNATSQLVGNFPIINFSCNTGSNATQSTNGITVDFAANIAFNSGHVEQAVNGFQLGSTHVVHNISIRNFGFNGTAGKPMTTGINITSSGADNVIAENVFAGANITNLLVNNTTSCTITAAGESNALGWYWYSNHGQQFTSSLACPDIWPAKTEDFSAVTVFKLPITGSTQCVHVSSTGQVSGTGSDCFSNPMTTIGDMIGAGAAGAPARITGGKTGQVPTATNGATPAFTSPGVADGNGGAAVTATPYAIQCDSSTALIDRVTTLRFQSGASVINAPDHTATGCGGNMVFTLIDDGAGTLTVNRGGTDTFSVFNGATNTDGATSFTLTNGQYATLNNGAGGVWEVRLVNGGFSLPTQYTKGSCTELWGGSGTSFALTSGDDAISNNSCYNDSGVTRTITAVKCRSDIASNTTTVNPTFGASGTGTTVLSGALTCGSSLAYSSSGTVSNASWTTGTGVNPAMGGTLTGTSIAMIVEYTF